MDPEDASFCVAFSGHKRGVTSVNFDSTGSHLASASKDTTVIVWDVVAESGVVRLKGHKDAVTQVRIRGHTGGWDTDAGMHGNDQGTQERFRASKIASDRETRNT